MAYELSLAYGGERLGFTFRKRPDVMTVQDPPACAEARAFAQDLSAALDTARVDLSRPSVVVADKTRLCGYADFLPVLLKVLADYGADPQQVTLWIAYGTHAPQAEAESRRIYGAAWDAGRWREHCCDSEDFVQLGVTRRGTPVRLPKAIVGASCLITFGAISHHYFAGYGGGRKLIFPGLGEKRAIYANHGLFLDRVTRDLAEGCRPGRIAGNPLAEDLAECETFRPADLAVHGILDSHGRVCELRVGRGPEHFAAACARHAEFTEIKKDETFDLVLASCGGFPKDINFIQSHKAVHHAAAFVSDGGRLIVLAECRDGIGSHTFLPWFEMSRRAAFERLCADYQGNGGTALAVMAKTRRIRIDLVSRLPAGQAARMGCGMVAAEQVQDILDTHSGSLALIPTAGLLVRKALPKSP